MQDLPKEALEKVASYFQALSEPTRLSLLNRCAAASAMSANPRS